MKEAMLALFAVVVVSVLALGILVVPETTGQSVYQTPLWSSRAHPSPALDVPLSPGQYSPAQYSYYSYYYPYATALKQCMYDVPCRVPDDACLSGAALFVDGSKSGCAASTLSTNWCGHYKIGWNGGSECSAQAPNMKTQCVCP